MKKKTGNLRNHLKPKLGWRDYQWKEEFNSRKTSSKNETSGGEGEFSRHRGMDNLEGLKRRVLKELAQISNENIGDSVQLWGS